MNIKQMAEKLVSYDCGIVTAICFFSTIIVLFANLWTRSIVANLIQFVFLFLVYTIVFYFYRVKFLSNLLLVEYSFFRILKLL